MIFNRRSGTKLSSSVFGGEHVRSTATSNNSTILLTKISNGDKKTFNIDNNNRKRGNYIFLTLCHERHILYEIPLKVARLATPATLCFAAYQGT